MFSGKSFFIIIKKRYNIISSKKQLKTHSTFYVEVIFITKITNTNLPYAIFVWFFIWSMLVS